MSDRSLILTGRAVASLAIIAATVAVVAMLAVGSPLRSPAVYAWLALATGAVAWVTIGAQPRNGVVWALIGTALFTALGTVGAAAFNATVPESIRQIPESEIFTMRPADLPTDAAIALIPVVSGWIPGFLLVLTVVLLLFPDGRPLSPRWRWLVWFSLGVIVVGVLFTVWTARPSSTFAYDTSASETSEVGAIALGIAYVAWLLAAAGAILASIGSLAVRYRRSSGDARHQIRWILWAGALYVLVVILLILDQEGEAIQIDDRLVVAVAAAAILVLLVSFGVAITRYRLYDIDVVISRTVTYGALAIFITATYVAIVVGVGSVLGSGDRPNLALAIGATAVVALLFQPVRSGVQHFANRLVYGKRATPYETLSRFSKRAAAAESDADMLERIPRLIVDGTGATQATLWTATNDELMPAASWPVGDATAEADYSVSVEHHGEVLGALTLSSGRGDTIAPAEEELVQNLASGLGLAMQNARLTDDLRAQVHELAASRERILSAADEARRALERDLDMGPQQELVAVKVKLGVARARADATEAPKTAEVLGQLEADTGAAIESVRDFARGVYPPLLEADGLVAAVSAEGAKSALPVAIEAGEVGRYPREVETAVFFSILESLQNAAKYSGASAATVTLDDNGERLRFSVSDDGRGFDPTSVEGGSGLPGMADRLDAAGGTVQIESTPGRGTTVKGSVPTNGGRYEHG